jgi:hypothetical protein
MVGPWPGPAATDPGLSQQETEVPVMSIPDRSDDAPRPKRGEIKLKVVADHEPEGPLDSSLGMLLRDCEKRIRANDLESLRNRWYSGGLMLRLRGDRQRLPMGVRQALVEQLSISAAEINHRMRLAAKYQLESLPTLVGEFTTWDNIRRKALYESKAKPVHNPKPKAKAKTTIPLATSARDWSKTLTTRAKTRPLTAADRRALIKLANLINELLEGEGR